MANRRNQPSNRRAFTLALLVVAAVVVVLFLVLQPADPPVTQPQPQVDIAVPKLYRAEAAGLLNWESTIVAGTVRARFRAFPDGEVEVYDLKIWADDTDLTIDLPWWQADVKRLRCLRITNDGAITGSLNDDQLTIAPSARFAASFFDQRDLAGRCQGKVRALEGATPNQLLVTHQPDSDYFAVAGTLTPGEGISPITLNMHGSYLNRPPVAAMTMADSGPAGSAKPAFVDLCPEEPKGDGPVVSANTAEGLSWLLQSDSEDPDGIFEAESGPTKYPRADIAFERWLYWGPEGFEFLGTGRQLGPVLFAEGADHTVLLRAIDREGAESRAVCRFHVTEQS